VPANPTPEVICSKVAQLLRDEREKRRLSLNALAERAGLSRQTIAFVEQEMRTPNLDTLLRLTCALGTNLEQIVTEARKLASMKTK
jgi:transcriptional regulator with XRE-family HTH domain